MTFDYQSGIINQVTLRCLKPLATILSLVPSRVEGSLLISPLECTLTNHPATHSHCETLSLVSATLTNPGSLTPLECTLTKKGGRGVPRTSKSFQTPNSVGARSRIAGPCPYGVPRNSKCFHQLSVLVPFLAQFSADQVSAAAGYANLVKSSGSRRRNIPAA